MARSRNPSKRPRRAKDGRPRVTIKFAQSLDGRIATATGDSKWISSAASLRLAHKLRSEHDAILVGVGTVLADDPQLNVRLVNGRNPLRVVVDSRLRIPIRSKLLTDGAAHETLIATTSRSSSNKARRLEHLGAEVLRLPVETRGSYVNLELLLRELNRRGIKSVLVEGGARIITSLLRADLADRLVVVIAPKIIGRGKESVGDLGITRLRDALEFSSIRIRRLQSDIVFDATL